MVNYDDYKLRVINANRVDLTLITFELVSENIKLAIENFSNDSIFFSAIEESKKFLRELISSLDMKQKIAYELYDLYSFVRRILIRQTFKKDLRKLQVATDIINNIHGGFDEIKGLDNSVLMENTDSVYAGLTYKNGQLTEYVEPRNKGYKI